MKIVIYFLALIGCVSLLYLGVRNLTTTAVASSDSWNSTWTAVKDSDYGTAFVNWSPDEHITWRTICPNQNLVNCRIVDVDHPLGRGDLANNDIYSSPPTVVGWNVSGAIGSSNFIENWVAGDGTGPETDFYFTQKAYAGTTYRRDYIFIHFTGEAELIRDGRGTELSLNYKWSVASQEGNNMSNCRTLGVCYVLLRWGESPHRLFNQSQNRMGYGQEQSTYMKIMREMSPGVPAKWTVTGRIN